jgi:surface carbohydrate biosynthesis protein
MPALRQQPRRWLLVPIETKVRELDGKTLFTCVAAEAGYGVIRGHKAFCKDLSDKPRGILVDKSVFATKSRLFLRNREQGNRGVAWCEEGLVVPSTHHYVEDRVSPECLAALDLFIAWGPNQAEAILKKNPDARIAVCGNPRMDALRPEFREIHRAEAERLRREYGD